MQTKDFAVEFKAGDKPGSFKGYGAVFGNRDLGSDVIEPGAFKKFKTTKFGKIRIPLYHDLSQIVGQADVEQDEKGLHVSGQLNMALSYASDTYELMKDGSLDAMSVGFNILKGGAEWVFDEEKKQSTRYISKAELWEVSIVPFGMNPKAKVTSVKAAPDNIRDFERFLREVGNFSRAEANALASGGFKALQRDAGALDSETLHSLKAHIRSLN